MLDLFPIYCPSKVKTGQTINLKIEKVANLSNLGIAKRSDDAFQLEISFLAKRNDVAGL